MSQPSLELNAIYQMEQMVNNCRIFDSNNDYDSLYETVCQFIQFIVEKSDVTTETIMNEYLDFNPAWLFEHAVQWKLKSHLQNIKQDPSVLSTKQSFALLCKQSIALLEKYLNVLHLHPCTTTPVQIIWTHRIVADLYDYLARSCLDWRWKLRENREKKLSE
eukprot:70083_1